MGIPHIEPNLIWNFELILPPLPEQKQIVAKIEALFTELENGKQKLLLAKQQLETYKQSLLKAAFEGRLTNKNVKDGELPNGWEWVKFDDIFEIFIGSTPRRNIPEYWNGTINWISSGEVAFCDIYNTKENISQKGLENSSCKVHPTGTVIIAMIGEGKTRGQVALLKTEAACNQNTAAIRVNSKIYNSELLYHYLALNYEKNRAIGSGNNQKALNKERIKNIEIPLIPIKEQVLIVKEIKNKLNECKVFYETITQSLQNIETLKQSILQQAFEGKLVNTKTASKIKKATQAKVVSITTEIYKPKSEYFYQCQILATVIRASNKKNIQHGEMTLAKMAYLVDKVFKIPTYYQYKQWHLGPYAPAMKKAINKKEFFSTKGNHITIADEQKLFKYENPNIVLTENAVDELSAIFIKYDTNIRSHKIELLATVCKVVEDIKTTALSTVLKAMQNWIIDITKTKNKFKNKAEKFTLEETRKTLEFLVSKGWDKKLIN